MSVAEIAPRNDDFERTPPHDVAAEQCVLGGMLLSKDAIADVVEVIRPADFYRPAHQLIYEAILDLYGRGEPADAITVAAELTRRGELARVGGAPYLHTLIAVGADGRERRLLRADRRRAGGAAPARRGRHQDRPVRLRRDADADELVDRAQAEVYAVTERRASEDYARCRRSARRLDEMEAIGSRGGTLTGVPTGFADLDALTNGLHPGQLIVIAARPAMGKTTLALDFARAAAIRHGMASVVFQPGDEPHRDHDAAAVGRVASSPAEHAFRPDERRRLGPAGAADRRGRRRAAVHRRLASHVDDGDPGQVPPAQAASRAFARRR